MAWRSLWLWIGAAALLAGAVAIGWWSGPPPVSPPPPTPVPTPELRGSWTSYRGDASQTGRGGSLPDEAPRERWSYDAGRGIRSSAVIDSARVFVGCDDGRVLALDREDGTLVWEYTTGGAVEAPPVLLGGLVIVGATDGLVYAFEAASGEVRWKAETDAKITGGATALGADRVLVPSYDNLLHCLEVQTGTSLWTFETQSHLNAPPTVWDDRIVFGGCDGFVYIIDTSGQELGTIDLGAYVGAPMAISEGVAYVGQYDNAFFAVDLASVAIAWTYRHRNFPYLSPAAVGDSLVVFGGGDRRVHGVRRNDGEAVWRFKTGARVESGPLVCGDKVLCASLDGRLYALGLADGAELWSLDLGAPLLASPAHAGDVVVIGSEAGRLFAFDTHAGEDGDD